MILEYTDNVFSFNGEELRQQEKLKLVPDNNNNYIFTPCVDGPNEDQCIIIDPQTGEVEVIASWFGESPLFYFISPSIFILSLSYQGLLARLPTDVLNGLEFDKTAIYESFLFNAILRNRTFYKKIKKIVAGKKLFINAKDGVVREVSYFVLPFHKEGDISLGADVLVEQAIDIYENLVLPKNESTQDVLLPLSGGFDSRLLACLMKKQGQNFHSITFGTKESTEPFVARKIAKSLDVELKYLELKDGYYPRWGDEVTRLTGGLSNHRHCHMYACFNEHNITSKHIVHGFMGDVYAGASQPGSANNYNMGADEALNRYIVKHTSHSWIWQQMTESERGNVIADLTEIMQENCKVNLPCHFDEYIHNVDRQFALIANIFSPLEAFGKISRPFANKDYALFFNTLPFHHRNNRQLFKKACSKLFPKEFSYGNQDQVYSRNSFKGKLENLASAFYAKLAYSSMKYSKGKFVIRNPKAIERHHELLFTTLHSKLDDSVTNASELLGKDFSYLKEVNSDLQGQYGTLTLNALSEALKQLRNSK